LILENKINEKIVNNLKVAKYITTTTTVFASEIKKINPNVFILPNAIDPNESQFKEITPESDRLRVGWLGGSSHLHDLMLLDGMTNILKPQINKLQFVLCGFDTRGVMTEINKETGEQKQIELTADEITEAAAMKAAWDAEQAAKQAQPTQEEIIAGLIARIAALETK
jgi:hypothetical protein